MTQKGFAQFLIEEILVYLSQIMVFFWVAFLVSSSLSDESKLVDFLGARLNKNSISEVGYIILATIITLGIIKFIESILPNNSFIEKLTDEVIRSISRTIYFFGSSTAGTILAAFLYLKVHPDKTSTNPTFFLGISFVFGLSAFLYGVGISYLVKHKKILSREKQEGICNACSD